LLTAEVDPGRVTEELMALDVCGHYSRPDIFTLLVDDQLQTNIKKNSG
jgi:hypothetical protein